MINSKQLLVKRGFDLLLGFALLPFLVIPMVLLVVLATVDTRCFGWFAQERVGQHGRLFRMFKIRTLRVEPHALGDLDASASSFGRFLRRYKLDELPQLFNVLFGQMSFVGPRPDVPGFADALKGADRMILMVKPGITGPASLKYQHEAQLLAQQAQPEVYNREVIWADKVKINKAYVETYRFSLDLRLLLKSIFS
jgi:lipopolysaccharide/colanic/teichoic acid biosynthesis glycosyltransferase